MYDHTNLYTHLGSIGRFGQHGANPLYRMCTSLGGHIYLFNAHLLQT